MTPIYTANAAYQVLTALKTNRRKRNELREVFVEGIESIKQLDVSSCGLTRIIICMDRKLSDWGEEFIRRHAQVPVTALAPELYQSLSDKNEPAEMMVTAQKPGLTIETLTLSPAPLIVVCDRPSDHGNLGSIIRSANSLGSDAVITTGHGVDIWDPKVIRSSLGSVFLTPVVHEESSKKLEDWLSRLKETRGLTLAGTDSQGEVGLADARVARPIALILGNESKGMSVGFREFADFMVSIPLEGGVNSLNVACAASIFLWEISRNSTIQKTKER